MKSTERRKLAKNLRGVKCQSCRAKALRTQRQGHRTVVVCDYCGQSFKDYS